MSANPYDEWTYEGYRAFESRSETRHEYHQGHVYAMSGSTKEHSLITNNVIVEIGTKKADDCELHSDDILIVYPPRDVAFYPNLSVVCGEPLFEKGISGDALLNPGLIVEVLSRWTERKDMMTKLPVYQAMPTVQDILYIRQDRVQIMHWYRRDEKWTLALFQSLADQIVLASINVIVDVRMIYKQVYSAPEGQNS